MRLVVYSDKNLLNVFRFGRFDAQVLGTILFTSCLCTCHRKLRFA